MSAQPDDVVLVESNTKTSTTTSTNPKKRSRRSGDAKSSSAPSSTNDPSKRPKKKKKTTSSAALKEAKEAAIQGLQNITKKQTDAFITDSGAQNFSNLILKPDHHVRPIWVTPDKHIFLETFSPIYQAAYDFLVAVAEPLSRPENVHEYVLTEYSLYAAVSIGLDTENIIKVLEKLSKVFLSKETKDFITNCTSNYGKVKLVILKNRFHVESSERPVIMNLLRDPEISDAAIAPDANNPPVPKATVDRETGRFYIIKKETKAEVQKFQLQSTSNKNVSSSSSTAGNEMLSEITKAVQEINEEDDDDDEITGSTSKELFSFEINHEKVEHVKKRCLKIDYPLLEEYDFKNDTNNEDLAIDLKPTTTIRSYQEKSLSKMFSNGRARSGIIVLPCGAGKTLVGITAACTVKKSTLVLCINQVSVEQWKNQFRLWTNVDEERIITFTATNKMKIPQSGPVIVITTYNMITHTRQRNQESAQVMQRMQNREWGLMLLDEVHVAPAEMFRKVISVVKAHCKLGLTATLLREDDKIDDLYFLVGSKLYEANWLDLQRGGFLATVECVEVWCPMSREFYNRYLDPGMTASKKKLLYVMNPNKVRACEFLIRYHEKRGDKIIVFSDNVFALRYYAEALRMPFIFGDTSQQERLYILEQFRQGTTFNTVFISKIGDTAIDIPEATVIIQISSHFGSRRQEAQRLGRILRPKGLGSRNQQAFFYSLVSQDTSEMFYSTKRQKFLVDQGYSYRVLNNVHDVIASDDGGQEMKLMKSKQEELKLLEQIMAADDKSGETEQIEGLNKKTRKNASAKDKSGGKGAMYTEVKKTSHPLFRRRNK